MNKERKKKVVRSKRKIFCNSIFCKIIFTPAKLETLEKAKDMIDHGKMEWLALWNLAGIRCRFF